MDRYIFFSANDVGAGALTSAKKTARALGAKVVGTAAGSMLLEAAPAQAAEVAKALPGWRCTAERKSVRVPERTPLQRAKSRGTAAGQNSAR